MGVSSTECLEDWNQNATYEELKRLDEISSNPRAIIDQTGGDANSILKPYSDTKSENICFAEAIDSVNTTALLPISSRNDYSEMGCEVDIMKQNVTTIMRVRSAGSRKEKKRTEFINNAFSELRKRIPNVPMDTKLSKIKTLRLATSYIAYLTDIIQNSDPSDSRDGRDFRADLKALRTRERRRQLCQTDIEPNVCTTNNEQRRATDEYHNDIEKTNVAVNKQINNKRRKGRTGWPEAVWAMELENNSTKNISQATPEEEHDFRTEQISFQNGQADNHIYSTSYVIPPLNQNINHHQQQNLSDATQAICFLNTNGNYIQNTLPVYKYIQSGNETQNTNICAMGTLNREYSATDDFASHFTYPTLALPAASSFSKRLPPIPRLLHREEDLTFTPELPMSEFNTTQQNQNEFPNAPSFAELKTVSVAKISTDAMNGRPDFSTTALQCIESTPVV